MIIITVGLLLSLLIALGISQRFRSLVVQHRRLCIATLLGLIGVIVFAFVVVDYFSVDACLDSGGRWDKKREVCQHEESSAVP